MIYAAYAAISMLTSYEHKKEQKNALTTIMKKKLML